MGTWEHRLWVSLFTQTGQACITKQLTEITMQANACWHNSTRVTRLWQERASFELESYHSVLEKRDS